MDLDLVGEDAASGGHLDLQNDESGLFQGERADPHDLQAVLQASRELALRKGVGHPASVLQAHVLREYVHQVGHSYRSHVPIEPYLSDQWYVAVSVAPLAMPTGVP